MSIEDISQKIYGKESPTQINEVIVVLMHWANAEMSKIKLASKKKNIKLLKDLAKVTQEVALLKDKLAELGKSPEPTDSSKKSVLFRKRKVKSSDKVTRKPEEEETPKKSGKILVTHYNDACLVHGSTYEHRDIIKKYHGKWTKEMKGWIVPLDLRGELTGELKNYIANIIENNLDEYLEKKQPNMDTSYHTQTKGCLIDSDSD